MCRIARTNFIEFFDLRIIIARVKNMAHCNDIACTDATVSVVDDSLSNKGLNAINSGSDGVPVIVTYDTLSRDLKVAHCPDPVTCVLQ